MLAEHCLPGQKIWMRLRDYLLGRRFELVSPLGRNDVASRVNAATPSTFSFLTSGVVGWCRFGFLQLHWSVPMFSNGFAPVLSARLHDDMGRTRIAGRYGAPRYLQAWFVLWWGLLGLFLTVLAAGVFGVVPRTENEWIGLIIGLIFAAVPLIFHGIFNRNADDHFEAMLDMLERETGAVRVS